MSSHKITKWDRPPEPKDWRFYVGTLGRVLIATGLLLFGFVAYQLWGTGIATGQAQRSLEDEFLSAVPQSDAPAITAPLITTPSPDNSATTVPATTAPATTGPQPGAPVAVDLSQQAVSKPAVEVVPGRALMRLEIPAIDKKLFVLPGVAAEDLHQGPGHFPNTPMPGQLGNSAIAGHRTTSGAPFARVDELEPGDELIVTNRQKERFVYEVTGLRIVNPEDTWVVETSDPNIAELTLTSCHPEYTARQRIIVHSVLNPDKSAVVGTPTFYDLGNEYDAAVAEPTTTTPATGPGTTAVANPSATTVAPAVTVPPEQPTIGGSSGEQDATDTPTAAPTDAFSQGWFHDMDAFPQIALWGTAMSLIAIFAYALSRRFRRDSVGFAVGIVPFVLAAYFFFQNVNRLLPPGL